MRRSLAGAFALLLSTAAPGAGQTRPTDATAPTTSAVPAIDGRALGVSLSRIQRRLSADAEVRTTAFAPLKLEYYVDVYGTAPALRFFTGESLIYGPVPGSAPTHRDMLWHVTPQAFRSPRVDFLGLATGAAMYGARKIQNWNYERELAAYKKLVEAGKNVPAPKAPKP
jgi:hypothetical protein